MNISLSERYRGSLFGLAIGDAFGTTLEFQKVSSKEIQKDIIGGGPFSLMAGQWTDDTSMALCLAESLIEKRGFVPRDQLERYNLWYREGKLSSNGECFDIGITVRMALESFTKEPQDYPVQRSDKSRSGNGNLMRFAPIPLFYRKNSNLALEKGIDSSRTTHCSLLCTDASRYFTALFLGIFEGSSKEELLFRGTIDPSTKFIPKSFEKFYWSNNPLSNEIETIASGSFRVKEPPEIKSTGFVVDSLECALWAFYHTNNFKDGLIKVVNLGGDADTAGAIYGQIAGCYYGISAIPLEWQNIITYKSLIEVFSDELLHLSEYVQESDSVNADLSENYKSLQSCFVILENGYKVIKRKLLPSPHSYKTIQSFQEDCKQLLQVYKEKVPDSNVYKDSLMKDFQKRFEFDENNLKLKLMKSFEFALPKKIV